MSCALYALLYTIALFVEIAYQYSRFSSTIWKLAPFVFLWISSTSVFGLVVAWKRVQRKKSKGLSLSLTIFVCASLLLYMALGFYLPDIPITEANFQTYTAHGAYLKSVCYFLFLSIVFLIVPFHFVLSAQEELEAGQHQSLLDLLRGGRSSAAPRDAIYLRAWWLGILLIIVTLMSPLLAAHLFDNLKPNAYLNLFMQLVQWRILLYLALGMECLLWYYYSLNRIRRACLRSGVAMSSAP